MFANIQTALEWGITEFDTSIGGLGVLSFMVAVVTFQQTIWFDFWTKWAMKLIGYC